jgi:hypothetical protein
VENQERKFVDVAGRVLLEAFLHLRRQAKAKADAQRG